MAPPINHLNPPPNPFWDFVADMQNHPFFTAPSEPHQEGIAATNAGPSNAGERQRGDQQQQQQNNVGDPPEVDPATLGGQQRESRREGCRGRRRRGSNSDEEGEHHRRGGHGRRGWGGPWGHRGWGGPMGPPGGFPFAGPAGAPWGAQPHAEGEHQSPPGPPPPPESPFGPRPGGMFGRGGPHRRGGPHDHHHPHPHPHPHHHHPGGLPHRRGPRGPGRHRGSSPSPPPPPPPGYGPPGFGPPGPHRGFDLQQFLSNLGNRIGVDLGGAAENFGLDKFIGGHEDAEADFEPKADIFSTPTNYTIHISLPGAKKSDVGVDWDGEHSSLHVAGVVYRPEVDETMLSQLVVDGRKRETGVFEKTIRLGTRSEPAVVDVAGIRARMVDGVLIVTVPKLERRNEKREVNIEKSATPSPVREVREKELIDTDHEMGDLLHQNGEGEIQLVDRSQFEQSTKDIGKEKEAKHHESEKMTRERSATIEAESRPQAGQEQELEQEPLPVYTNIDAAVERHEGRGNGSDWENFGSDDEGDYVKITVD